MIKTVIKRDGREETFSDSKINNWIQWSEKTVNPRDFNWSTIVLRTISTLPDTVSTKELQEALIRECLNQDTWEGSRMAGRLYASALPKELYESRKHPTIKELHVKLYEKGLIIDTSEYFTNEEYDEINKMLVHRRDYTYSHYAIKQLIQKYSMQDRVLKQSYETPQFIYMRVAMQTYMNYQGSDRLSKLKSLYEDLSHQRINVPTPYFSYSLTVKPNTASCFLPHTLVDLETCRKKISEVEVGSKVLTHTGQFKTVIDKFSRIYSGKMVQINTVASYINEFESTYNHRIYAIKATSPELIKQTSKCKPEWIEADHIRVGDYIKLGVNLDVYDKPTTIWDIIHNNYLVKDYVIENDKIKKIILTGKDRGQSFKKHPETNNINIFDKELFRLIGYYLAEGCITKPERQNSENFQLTFGTKEEVFINDAINIVYHLFGIKLSRYDNPSDNSTKLQTYNKPLCALMLELCNTGFDKKYLHDLILKAPRELQEELLVGVIRGDGCSTISGFRLSLTNKELIYQLKNIALRCNIHISMSGGIQSTRYPDKKPSCILQFNVDGLSDFAKKVNKNIDKIRKNKSCSGLHIVFREDGIFARAREISSYYIENQEVWDLTVEDDHSFIVNSLTVHNCSVLTCGDEAESIGVLNTLAYTLTTAGAGVGAHMKTRSLGDGIRNGSIKHAGKVPYYRAFANVMRSSMQASRSGASTMHFPVFDPEVEILMGLKNPLSTLVNRVRESDYAISINKPFVKRMVTDKPFWLFSYKDNPKLYEEFYHADSNKFDRHLEEFVVENPGKVTEVKASDLFSNGMNNRLSTGRLYVHFADTANKQTPYKDTIYSSNLCMEISNVTKPFKNHAELYSDTPDGVVGFCNLAGINIPHIKDDEEYEQACYNALMMIESGIENTKFVFPALNANLKDYRSAGVGVVGLAYLMAKKHMSYTTQEGRDFIFEQSEKFAYFVTKAAVKITEELGPCKVMDNNKYAEGWLPMDDASPAALALTTKPLSYDWDALREDMKRLGGLRFSTLMAHMPAESSSIACSLTNSIYPIRELSLTKTAGDSSNKWIAPEATKLAKWYEIAWNMSNEHHINNYALWQIFNDQSISADLYADRTKTVNIPMSQLFKEIAYSAKLGLKSHYYYNTLTDSKESTEFLETRIEDNTEAELEDFDDSEGCDSGGCTL